MDLLIHTLIKNEVDKIRDLLFHKHECYGNSALDPIRIFSKGSNIDGILVRIDDKLSRIKNMGIDDKTEDTITDLIGYLILLKIAIKNEKI